MMRDLSLSLRDLLTRGARDLPQLAAAQITFDRPAEGYNPAQPTVSLYLYDIRENRELRSNERVVSFAGGQATIQPPPLRVACTYLVTAWPGNLTGDELALHEHELLGQVLQVLAVNPTVPAASLVGTLAGQDPPMPVITAQADGLQSPADFWTALNNRLRPSLSVTVTLSVPVAAAVTAPRVISSEIILKREGVVAADSFRIGGRVVNAAAAPVTGARVSIPTLGLATTTDDDGRYELGPLLAGRYVLRAQQGGKAQSVEVRIPSSVANGFDVTIPS